MYMKRRDSLKLAWKMLTLESLISIKTIQYIAEQVSLEAIDRVYGIAYMNKHEIVNNQASVVSIIISCKAATHYPPYALCNILKMSGVPKY